MIKILIDNSILHHANCIKGQADSSTAPWGQTTVETLDYSQSIKILNSKKLESPENYIAAIANEIQKKSIQAYTSDALCIERLFKKHSKFGNTRFADNSLMNNLKIEKITTLTCTKFQVDKNLIQRFRDFLNSYQDNDYIQIKNFLSKKSNQDAWHIHSVLNHQLDYFLTGDSKLIRQIKSIQDENIKSKLLKIVKTPKALCEELQIPIVDDLTSHMSNPYL